MSLEIERLARLEEKLDLIYSSVEKITCKDNKTDEEIIRLRLEIAEIKEKLRVSYGAISLIIIYIVIPIVKKFMGV